MTSAAALRANRRLIWPLLLAAIVGVAALWWNSLTLESGLRIVRDGIRSTPASGQVHIVEIDARSIHAIDKWPWPRSEHARLIDALRRAGARSIAFDVDFSSRSTPADDAALAAALERAEGSVILPTLRQLGSSQSGTIIEALPIEPLRRHAVLGSVSILPDPDGYVRAAPFGIITGGSARPALAALIAGRSGRAFEEFPIDYAIDPATIPRHSFVDVVGGKTSRSIAGRDVMVGATAVEMGDRYAVPGHGVIPGVVIQALAAETLLNGVPKTLPAIFGLIVALVGCGWIASARRLQAVAARTAIAWLGLFATLTAAEHWLQLSMVVVPALSALGAAAFASVLMLRIERHRTAARIDAASGLPNRLAMIEGGGEGAVMACFIDRYDEIVAAVGTDQIGDYVLRVAQRISLSADVTVYRVDDRSIAWRKPLADDNIDDFMARLRTTLVHPVEVAGRRIDVGLAVGVVLSPPSDSAAAVDAAMIAAVQAAEAHVFWTEATGSNHGGLDTLSLMGDLAQAIEAGTIEVHFQPKLALATRTITSAEALVRWHHPTRGPIPPDQFIALAERNDRIDSLTLLVLERVLDMLALQPSITVAINLSAKLLTNRMFNAALTRRLAAAGDLASRLILEVTESAAIGDMEGSIVALEGYRALGIAVSMDDYGTGQSTLTYIRRLPLSELKLDRSFVQNAHRNDDDAILVRSTIDMAHALGLKVVAEGVEDLECFEFLAASQCDFVQGWFVSKALTRSDFCTLLERRSSLAA